MNFNSAALVGFDARTDLVVIGTNPEMADYDNPRGHIFGFSAYVSAEDRQGNRRSLHIGTDRFEGNVLPKAERLAAALTARLAKGKLPVGFDAWGDDRPAYGSDAYVAYGADNDRAWERELDEFGF